MSDAMQREIDALLDAATQELELLQDDIAEHLPHYVLDDGTDEPANARETVEYAGDELKRLRSARIRELEARVTGGLAGEPRQAYRGEGAAASDEQPRPASPPTVGDLLANVIRKMTLHDWHLRLTQEEANALKQWVLERNGEDKPRRRPRRRG